MQSLIEFFEKETNKKINMFKYNNEKITSNQNLIEFNNTTYVIEFLKDSILNHVNGHCYLFNQQNLDFDSLKNILNNLYEDVQIYNYNNYLLLVSDDILDIDCSTPTIIESETYSKTYIIYLEKITNIDNLDFKINITNELIDIIINDSNTSKFITLNDLIMYKVTSIASNNKQISSLIKYDIIKNIDKNLLTTGINFIENDLNISKTSNMLFLHRNTLIYRLEKIKEYLSNANSKIPDYNLHFCENQAADSVISHYAALAKRENIPFQAKADLPAHISIDQIDMCLVLSNLLENALEASLKAKSSNRRIHAEVYLHHKHLLLIQVENTFEGKIQEKNHIFQSSKRIGNGVGIQSVRHIAEKSGGDSSFTYENGVFTAKIMLRIQKTAVSRP